MKKPPYPEIPESEYRQRLAGAQAFMSAQGLDGLLLFCEENIAYHTGFQRTFESPTYVWMAAVIPQKGDPTIVVVHGIYNIVNKSTWVEDIRPFGGSDYWGCPKDPLTLLLDTIEERLPGEAVIGAELGFGMHIRLTINEFDAIRSGLSRAGKTLIDASAPIWRQRAVKSSWEQDLYRTLGDITAKGFLAGLMTVHEGCTEREILRAMWSTFIAEGAYDTPMRGQLMIRSGQDRYDMYCARPTDRRIQRGEQIMLDSGPCYKGYLTDIQRHACIGEPPRLQRELFEQSRVGLEAALDAIRPGVTASDVYRTAKQAMEKVGVNTNVHWTFFGHSIGLTNHEPPMIVPSDDTPLEAGMVLSVEVPAYDVPEFRVLGGFLEECVLVTGTGYELLTGKAPRDLWIAR